MMIQSFARNAIIGLAVASFFAACAEPRPLAYPSEVEPRISDQAQSLEAAPNLIAHLPITGNVLIAGGVGGGHASLKTAEFYDPTTLKFTLTGPMASPRAGFGAVAFAGGTLNHEVVVAGGANGKASIAIHTLKLHATALDTAQQYDPATGKFTATAGLMVNGRAFFATTPLNDGTVLITGGVDSFGVPMTNAEIFDPTTGTFTATTGAMNAARALHTATRLNDGTVLIAGGVSDTTSTTSSTAELYNPVLKTFANVASPMIQGAAGHTATLISGCSCALDGQVVLTGGFSVSGVLPLRFAFSQFQIQIFDPSGATFTAAPSSLTDDRAFHTATLLANGKVLIAGGLAGIVKVSLAGVTAFPHGGARNSAEIFDPATSTVAGVNGIGTTRCNASMVNARGGHTATLFASGPLAGQVLLAGGVGGVKSIVGTPHPLATAELYNPATGAAGAFTATGKMHAARVMQQAALLQ